MIESMPAPTPQERRIVIYWRSGIRQIIGYTNEQPPTVIAVENGDPVSLVRTTPRMHVFHQMMKPEGLGTFDGRQQ